MFSEEVVRGSGCELADEDEGEIELQISLFLFTLRTVTEMRCSLVGSEMCIRASAPLLRGASFGLRVDRARVWETSFEMHVDRALSAGGDRLRRGCCLGTRRRWPRLDAFGRWEVRPCCAAPNLWACHFTTPAADHAERSVDACGRSSSIEYR